MHAQDQSAYVRDVAERLRDVTQGERGAIIAQAARFLAVSEKTVYRRLASAGYDTGRKTRNDAGTVRTPKELALLASGMISAATRKNGKSTLSLQDCRDRLAAQGYGVVNEETGEITMPSVSALSNSMRLYGCHPDQIAAGKPHVTMRSLYPNHVHQLDASVCVMVRFPGKRGITVMDERLYNEKKPGNLMDIGGYRLVRYVYVDHCSGSLYHRYVQARGEDAEGFVGTMVEAISYRGPLDPMHGAPTILYTDPGSGLRASIMKNLCRDLHVELIHHQPGNARATGSVESAQNIIECKFESRLRFADLPDLATLNRMATEWRTHFNAHAIHSRLRCTRNQAWMRITDEQLRTIDRDVLQAIVAWQDQTRVVRDDYRISVDTRTRHGVREYDIRMLGHHGVAVGDKVGVRLNPYTAPAIVVMKTMPDGKELRFEVQPVEKDANGFDLNSPVFGQSYASHADTLTDKAVKTIERMARQGVAGIGGNPARPDTERPFGFINPMADVRKPSLSMPRAGTAIPLETPTAAPMPLNHAQAAKQLILMDNEPWEHDARLCNTYIKEQYPVEVPEHALPELAKGLRALLPHTAQTMAFSAATPLAARETPTQTAGGVA